MIPETIGQPARRPATVNSRVERTRQPEMTAVRAITPVTTAKPKINPRCKLLSKYELIGYLEQVFLYYFSRQTVQCRSFVIPTRPSRQENVGCQFKTVNVVVVGLGAAESRRVAVCTRRIESNRH